MTISTVNNQTHDVNEVIQQQIFQRLDHSLATLESALRQLKVNASRIAPPTPEQRQTLLNHLLAIAIELADAIDEITHHNDNRQRQTSTNDANEIGLTIQKPITNHNANTPISDEIRQAIDDCGL
jgi:phosphoenolpyruvate carboxylase